MIAVWVIGGVLSLCGSLALVELAVAHPKTGGLYVFIREGFGDAWAFTFGWANLWVIKPTLIAAITMRVRRVLLRRRGPAARPRCCRSGCAAILLLTGINVLGVREGAGARRRCSPRSRCSASPALCVAAFALPHAGAPPDAPVAAAPAHAARPLLLAMVLAMIPVLFAYDGWTDATYVGGEIAGAAAEPARSPSSGARCW